jgi:hypothetical protein
MNTQEINNRLRDAARALGFANVAVANNDVAEALGDLTEVCFNIASACEALAELVHLPIAPEPL